MQRLEWRVERLDHLLHTEQTDDHVFAAIEDLSAQRGRYLTGKDADGWPVIRAKRKPLAAGHGQSTASRPHCRPC